MIDTLRLTCPSAWFDEDSLLWLQRLQRKISQTNYDGSAVFWSLCSGIHLPSWADAFSISIGSRVTIEGSPKIYQGHNLHGTDDLAQAARLLVSAIFGSVFRLSPGSWPDASRWYVARIDKTYSFDFKTQEALDVYLDTVTGVQRGQRRAGVEIRHDDREASVDAMPSGRTIYIGKGSRYRVGKIYAKGADFRAHPPLCIKGYPDTVQSLASQLAGVGRFEEQIRAAWISRQAVRLGLLPERFADLPPGIFSENVAKYLAGFGVEMLSNVRRKAQPVIYFPVSYLSTRLDLDAIWEDEFSHLFAKESAMNDATLLHDLFDKAPTPGQAQAAYDFLCRIRSLGYRHARQSVTKSTFYRHRSLLNACGVSDAMMQDGAPLVRVAIDPVEVRAWRPERALLSVIEGAHPAHMRASVERLHTEVFHVAA
ncbi:MAG: hypothetical protein JJ714_03190 [Acidithiobacillus sp.]|nr:hypothetical protein [Acidithiobacillus sp.]